MATEEFNADVLLQRIQAEHDAASSLITDLDLSTERSRAISYYLGDVSRDLPRPGIDRSAYVSQDVSDVIDGLIPGLLEVILGDPPVSFAPVGEADVSAAQNETAACYHVLFVMNDGFQFVHDTLKAGLLEKVGYGKVRRVVETKKLRENYAGIPAEAIMIVAGQDGRLVSQVPSQTGAPGTLDVVIERDKPRTRIVVEPIAPEDIAVSTACRGNILAATYIGQDVEMTASQLVEMGVDPAVVDELETAADSGDKPERAARGEQNVRSVGSAMELNQANRVIEIREHYIETDIDGDGVTEQLIVHADNQTTRVLMMQEVEAHDYVSWSPIRITNRHVGRSVADKAMSYMHAKTAVTRTLFDNFFTMTHPRPVIADEQANEHTLDDYLLIRPGAPIRTAKALPIQVYQPQPIAMHVAPVLEMLDQRQEYSTGFSRAGVTIDKNSFNQTATGAGILNQTQQTMQKFYARMYVEQLFAGVLRVIHRHLRMGGIDALPIQVDQQWQTIRPGEWAEREYVTPNIDLGGMTKEQQFAFAAQAVGLVEKVITLQGGLKGPFVYPVNAYNAMRNFFRAGGRKDVGSYIEDPSTPPSPERLAQLGMDPAKMNEPKPPPPEVLIAQMQTAAFTQVEQLKAQIKADADIQVARIKAEADAAVERYKAELAQQGRALDAFVKAQQPPTTPGPAFGGMR